jgi:hypothetical protein
MINNHQVSRKKRKESDPHHAKDTRSIRVIVRTANSLELPRLSETRPGVRTANNQVEHWISWSDHCNGRFDYQAKIKRTPLWSTIIRFHARKGKKVTLTTQKTLVQFELSPAKKSIKCAFFTVKEDCTLTLSSLPQDIERRFESHEQSQWTLGKRIFAGRLNFDTLKPFGGIA